MGRAGGGLTGNFQALRDGISRIRRIGDAGPELWVRSAPVLRANIERQFARGTNPYGTKWKALAPKTLEKGRTPPPLTDTGGLRRSIRAEPRGWTLSIVAADLVAGLHQWGWRKRLPKPRPVRRKGQIVATKVFGTYGPKRQILPDGRIPNEWRQQIRKLAREIMGERLGRRVGVRELK